jgi:HEAT repeat protein
VDEQTRRQITWIVVVGAVAALIAMASARRGELDRLRSTIAYGSVEARVAAVARLVETQKLADAVADQPRWVQDNVVDAVAYLGTEKAIFQLMSIWGAVDAPVQPRITAAVSRLGPLAVPPLVQAMVDKDAKIRAGAPTVLIAVGEPCIPYLLPLMGAWDDYIRAGVAAVFGGIAQPVTGEMVKVLTAPPPAANQAGADTAEYLRRKDCATTSLVTMAIKALDALIGQLLTYRDPEVRGLAATTLGTIGVALKPEQIPQVIPPLLERAAKDEVWAVRRKATTAVGTLGVVAVLEGVVPPLIARLGDERPEVRAAAAEALGAVIAAAVAKDATKAPAKALKMDEAAAAALAQSSANQAAQVMAAALIGNKSGASRELSAALGRIGPPSIGPLQPGLTSASAEVRLWTTATIAQIGGARAVVPLAVALADSLHADVRKTAAEALRNQPAEALNGSAAQIVPALAKALQDPDCAIYYAARDALAKMGQPAVPALVQALAQPNSRVGYMAEMALARIGAPAVSGLLQSLRSASPAVVNWASIALGDIAEPAVIPLGRVLADASAPLAARAAAARALGDTGMAGALRPLLGAAKAPDANVRTAALQGLGKLADEGATPVLVEGLADSDRQVRAVATALLKNWRMGEVQALLKKALGSQDADTRCRAAVVLVFQNSGVTNQLLREISAVGAAQAQASETNELVATLQKAVLDTSAAPGLRRDAIVSLGFAGNEQSVGELQKLLVAGDPMALPAAVAVAQIGSRLAARKDASQRQVLDAGAKNLLNLVMQPTDPKLALAAATGLATMADIPVKVLVDQLGEGTDEQRAWAGAILAAIGKPATELLMRVRGATKNTWCAAALEVVGDSMAMQIMKHLPDVEHPQQTQVDSISAKLAEIRQAQSQ